MYVLANNNNWDSSVYIRETQKYNCNNRSVNIGVCLNHRRVYVHTRIQDNCKYVYTSSSLCGRQGLVWDNL